VYAVKILCEEVKTTDGRILTKELDEVWLCRGEWGPTTRHSLSAKADAAMDLMVFDTLEDAMVVGGKMVEKHHVWYHKPRHYVFVQVEPAYKKVQFGWKVI
jgi:hypothetical protein